MKNVLLIAFHFPPVKGSSGLHRALSMAKYLRDYGWDPVVLTASPKAYENKSDDLLNEIPEKLKVIRAFALDSMRHFSFKRRYFQFSALPDRWVSWWFGGVYSGLRQIKKIKPDLLWSTYPIATSHLIGLALHKLTGIFWVADFRDSMTEENYPRDFRTRSIYRWIEKKTVNNASMIIFTTSGAADMYARRYPNISIEKWGIVENAVDETFFNQVEKMYKARQPKKNQKLKIIHSGILYPVERDPTKIFNAILQLKKSGVISAEKIEIVFRASTNEDHYRSWVKDLGINDIVFFASGIPYSEAIEEMLDADGLLLVQSSGCNHQIPAKIYEYFRSGRPILGLTDPAGNTAELLNNETGTMLARLDNEQDIINQLPEFFRYCRDNRTRAVRSVSDKYSRRVRVEQYAKILNQVVN